MPASRAYRYPDLEVKTKKCPDSAEIKTLALVPSVGSIRPEATSSGICVRIDQEGAPAGSLQRMNLLDYVFDGSGAATIVAFVEASARWDPPAAPSRVLLVLEYSAAKKLQVVARLTDEFVFEGPGGGCGGLRAASLLPGTSRLALAFGGHALYVIDYKKPKAKPTRLYQSDPRALKNDQTEEGVERVCLTSYSPPSYGAAHGLLWIGREFPKLFRRVPTDRLFYMGTDAEGRPALFSFEL